jgi:hypothetical protein
LLLYLRILVTKSASAAFSPRSLSHSFLQPALQLPAHLATNSRVRHTLVISCDNYLMLYFQSIGICFVISFHVGGPYEVHPLFKNISTKPFKERISSHIFYLVMHSEESSEAGRNLA